MGLPEPYYDRGGITVYHGDCRFVLPHISADVLVTDPPYGVSLQSGRGGAFGDCAIAGDADTSARDWVLVEWGMKPAVVFGTWRIPRPAGTKAVLVWDKGEHVGMGDLSFPWKPNTEEIYILGDGFKGRRGGSVLRHFAIAGTVATSRGRHHPTEKPVGLMCELLEKCPPGVVVDTFAGSLTTAVAAKKIGRRCICIEREEKYIKAGIERLRQEVLPLGA